MQFTSAIAAAVMATVCSAQPSPRPYSNDADAATGSVNEMRTKVNVAPIAYSDDAAAGAQHWATYLATNGLLQHSSDSPEYGENVLMINSGASHAGPHHVFADAVNAWGIGEGDYDNETIPEGDFMAYHEYSKLASARTRVEMPTRN